MKTKIFRMTENNPNIEMLKECADIIRSGGLVAFPTETVYGLGANGLDPDACDKIYKAKQRPYDKGLILHLSDEKDADRFALLNDDYYYLSNIYKDKPLTYILKKKSNVPDAVSRSDTVAFRKPSNNIAPLLVSLSGCPIAAPSANMNGDPPPKCAEDVIHAFDGIIDAVIDAGCCGGGIPSTIISLANEPVIIRNGAVNAAEVLESIKRRKTFSEEPTAVNEYDNKKRYVIGVCGGSGAGKGIVSSIFRLHGAHVIECDAISRDVVSLGTPALAEIFGAFGLEYRTNEGTLDRAKMAETVFHYPQARKKLERIIHPYITREVQRRIQENSGIIIIDAPLLFEAGVNNFCDCIIGVTADMNKRLERIIARDNISMSLAKARISSQVSDSTLEKNCDYLVYNNGSISELNARIDEILSNIYEVIELNI